MNMDGKSQKTSHMGVFLTIVLSMTAIGFIYSKLIAINERLHVDIFTAIKENFHDNSYIYSAKDGLFIAAALTEYNADPEPTEDAKYGELIIEHTGWGLTESNSVEEKTLEFHYCSDEELGLMRTPETVVYPFYK